MYLSVVRSTFGFLNFLVFKATDSFSTAYMATKLSGTSLYVSSTAVVPENKILKIFTFSD